MNEFELQEAYEQLRSFAEQKGMSWILAELDEASSLGVLEVRTMRMATREGQIVYDELAPKESGGRGRRRAEEFISRRSMTNAEKVGALLTAFRRVLLDLDSVASASVDLLNSLPISASDEVDASESTGARAEARGDLTGTGQVVVSDIDFEPDEGSITPSVSTEAMRFSDRRPEVERLLGRLVQEVRS